jgi:hypothetical protein
MKNTASTYNIETPDTVYYSYDLTHFDYFGVISRADVVDGELHFRGDHGRR